MYKLIRHNRDERRDTAKDAERRRKTFLVQFSSTIVAVSDSYKPIGYVSL